MIRVDSGMIDVLCQRREPESKIEQLLYSPESPDTGPSEWLIRAPAGPSDTSAGARSGNKRGGTSQRSAQAKTEVVQFSFSSRPSKDCALATPSEAGASDTHASVESSSSYLFQKEVVHAGAGARKPTPKSSLATELGRARGALGLSRGVSSSVCPVSRSSAKLTLKVIFAENLTQAPLSLQVDHSVTVEQFLQLVLDAYCEQGRSPPLQGLTINDYELRMVDDDEPDEDLPPLQRTREIHKFDISAVALCPLVERAAKPTVHTSMRQHPSPRAGTNPRSKSPPPPPPPLFDARSGPSKPMPALDPKSKKKHTRNLSASHIIKRDRSISISANMERLNASNGPKYFIKVKMVNHESHILSVQPATTLEGLLPLLCKKKKDDSLNPKTHNFFYGEGEPPLDMSIPVNKLRIDEVLLRAKEALVERDATQALFQHYRFTPDTTTKYAEYRVIKTNRKGKRQNRRLGVDGTWVYNKKPDESLDSRSSIHHKFHKTRTATRNLKDVLEVGLGKGPAEFFIVFREENDSLRIRYESESREEAREIVARIQYLLSII